MNRGASWDTIRSSSGMKCADFAKHAEDPELLFER